MIRLAAETDLPHLVAGITAMRAATAWSQVEEEWTDDALWRVLERQLRSPNHVCYVWDSGDHACESFCGCKLTRFHLPPHMPVLYEWGLGGSKRGMAACWRACKDWGRANGARWACRGLATSGTKHRVREITTWEKL